jgi:ATP-dependent DNA ligase
MPQSAHRQTRVAVSAAARASREGAEPQLALLVKALKLKDAIVDGELCALLPDGCTSFREMQHFRAGIASLRKQLGHSVMRA